MSPRQWFSLLAFYISYLFFGASVFFHNEHKLEIERRAVAHAERIEINALLIKYIVPNDTESQDGVLEQVSEYCEQPVTHPSKDEFVPPYIWNFYHSFFFSFIVCSTVGYGNISPNNTFGRMFMILYALVGIPVHAILFAYMGDFFGKTFERLYNRYKSYKRLKNHNYVPPRLNLIGQITLYLTPAIIVFIFFPAMLFTYFEGWDYTVSIYYAFVTLTTIGFGDYVPTFQPHQERTFGIYFVFYQFFIILWFIFGVGYLVMIIGFLIKGLRSKRIKQIEHNLAINIKETQRKIWHGVTKDVGILRKVLNEVNFLKFKPVYKDPEETMRQFHIPKSQSCPHLFMDDDDEAEAKIMPNIKYRERAFSECIKPKPKKRRSASSMTLNRVQFNRSDSDLSHIDKEKTFALDTRRNSVHPGDLLAKVVMALGGYRVGSNEEKKEASIHSSAMGFHGLTDSQILASEQNYYSDWSIATSDKSHITPPTNQRRLRAVSDVRIPIEESVKASTEWTWSGANTQISEIENMRSRAAKPRENLYKTSLQTKLRYDSDAAADDFPQVFTAKPNGTATNKSLLSKLNPFKRKASSHMKRHSLAPGQELDPQKYFRSTQNGRESVSSLSKNYLTQRRPSRFSVPCAEEEQNLLETTTIADLIRAIEMAHADNVETENVQDMLKNIKHRKLGTDHLIQQARSHSLFPFSVNAKQKLASHTIQGSATDVLPVKASNRNRLYSCVSTPTHNFDNNSRGKILGDANPFIRHLSIRPPPPYSTTPSDSIKATMKRRFSVRLSNLDKAPGQFHNPQNSQIIALPSQPAANSVMTSQRKLSWRPTPSSLLHSNDTQKSERQKTDSTSSSKPT